MPKANNICSLEFTEDLALNKSLLLAAPRYAAICLSSTNSEQGAATSSYSSSLLRQYPVLAYSSWGAAGQLPNLTIESVQST